MAMKRGVQVLKGLGCDVEHGHRTCYGLVAEYGC